MQEIEGKNQHYFGYIKRCFWVILRDHCPKRFPFNGSGLPVPVVGCILSSSTSELIFLRIDFCPAFL